MLHRLDAPCAILCLLLSACDPDGPSRHDPGTRPDDTQLDTGPVDTDTGTPPAEGCRAQPQAADRERLVVVGYPYGSDGSQAATWGVFTLTTDGEIEHGGTRFDMGRGYSGHVAFTPDGSIGMVAHDDGTIGVFEALSASEVRVIHAQLAGDFYASAVVSDPSGEWAWIIDGNWAENGGGLYRATIDCDDGSFGTPVRVIEAKLPAALLRFHQRHDRALLIGREAAGAASGEDAFLLELGADPEVLGGADTFGDDEAIFAGAALTFDDAHLLIGDNASWSSFPNRVAVAVVSDSGLEAVQVLEDVDDPVDIVASPFDGAALVISGYSDAIFVLDYQPGAAAPFSHGGELSYVGSSPQLPTAAAVVERGSQKGLVVVTENQGLRRVQFGQDSVTDLGLESFGSGLEYIPGAVGLQP